MNRVRISPLAKQDIREAIDFYETQRIGLGYELFDEIYATIETVRMNPEAYGHDEIDVRKKLVHRFPYVVFYRKLSDSIDVVAVAHTSRSDKYRK